MSSSDDREEKSWKQVPPITNTLEKGHFYSCYFWERERDRERQRERHRETERETERDRERDRERERKRERDRERQMSYFCISRGENSK